MVGLAVLLVIGAQTGDQSAEKPFLSPVFGDHMVLQRDRANTFWGWTKPGTKVSVELDRKRTTTTADKTGKWTAKLVPPPAGGPYTLTVSGPSRVQLTDILVGDVWVCSGQSNMEFGITNANNANSEVAAADYPNIRLYLPPKKISYTPADTNPATWAVCTPQNIVQGGWGGFSAVGYFFGRELNRRLHIPIGLVGPYWGGTVAEAWTSKRGLATMKDFDAGLAQVASIAAQPGVPMDQQFAAWYTKNDAGSAANWQSPTFDASAWKTTTALDYDSIGLKDFDGVVWYRYELTLPDDVSTGAGSLSLGAIDDADTTWVNGTQVGGINGYNVDRKYPIAAGLLKPGKNVIVVRALDTGVTGGFTSPAMSRVLTLGDGKQIPLTDAWRYAQGADIKSASPLPVDTTNNPNVPTVLYNGMINPIVPLAIRGAIWYQGESNADRAKQYQRLLPTMIQDWRKSWGQGDFPFYIVQLANYMTAPTDPPQKDNWAELREAQAMTAAKVPHSGLAVAIDIGDANDIHPKDKYDVGYRLALNALRNEYGMNVECQGPTYKSMKREGDTIRVTFDHAEGLTLRKGEVKPVGFEIAGKDRKFYWATAELDGTSILVHSSSVPNPVAVRYAWAANPPTNLYNSRGLPAVPFRTDKW